MCESLYSVFSPQSLHRVAKPRLPAPQGACGNTVQCILAQTLHRVAKPRLPAPLGACGDTVQCIRVANTGQGRKALCRCSTGCRLHTCVVIGSTSADARAPLHDYRLSRDQNQRFITGLAHPVLQPPGTNHNQSNPSSSGVGESCSAASTVAGACLLYTSPSPRDRTRSRMPSSA